MRIVHIVGARPNFMKIAPIIKEMDNYPNEFEQILVHTGQHYDNNMSKIFFDELNLRMPDFNLNVGSDTPVRQIANIMLRFEPILMDFMPDWVFVPGDVNSAIACALAASKLGFKVAHIEAGLRSFDRSMPEEINRILIDHTSNLLFAPSKDAVFNLLHEGISKEKIYFVGNVMIDSLTQLLPKAEARWPYLLRKYKLDNYILVTIHRPSNTDNPTTLFNIIEALIEISHQIRVVFPVHPRTYSQIMKYNIIMETNNMILTSPMGYIDFLALEAHAALVLTDSGGVQEETTYLGIPCLTLRQNTERPITITHGTNRLISSNRKEDIISAIKQVLQSKKTVQCNCHPELWDGKAASRIIRCLRKNY